MKRICIYLTYDKQQIADQYIGYIQKFRLEVKENGRQPSKKP